MPGAAQLLILPWSRHVPLLLNCLVGSPRCDLVDPPTEVPRLYPPWWCVLPSACQGLERPPARVDACPPRSTAQVVGNDLDRGLFVDPRPRKDIP
jgi:hypothetical protein